MKRLPHWCITDKFPALYDTESATAIEQTAKLYGAMNELIDDYNAFVDKINEEIEAFETSSEKNYELFTVSMRQEFQDFIDTIELKVKAQDKAIADKFTAQDKVIDNSIKAQDTKIANAINQQNNVINDAVDYMKTNLTATLNSVIAEMKANGEFSEEVLKVFADMVNDINTLNARMNTFTKLAEGSTTADAELIDIRNGYDGTIYETAGEAVRGQVSRLSSEIAELSEWVNYKYSELEIKEKVILNGTLSDNPYYSCSNPIFVKAKTRIKGATYTDNIYAKPLAQCDSDGNITKVLVNGVDKAVCEFDYVAKNDMYIMLCLRVDGYAFMYHDISKDFENVNNNILDIRSNIEVIDLSIYNLKNNVQYYNLIDIGDVFPNASFVGQSTPNVSGEIVSGNSTIVIVPTVPNSKYYFSQLSGVYYNIVLYDADKNFISSMYAYHENAGAWEREWSIPENCYYVGFVIDEAYKETAYFGAVENYAIWQKGFYKAKLAEFINFNANIFNKNHRLLVTADTMSDAETLSLDVSDIKQNNVFAFNAKLDGDFSSVFVAHGKTAVYSGMFVKVDNTNVYFYRYHSSDLLVATHAHGLTIEDFISVAVHVLQDQTADVIVSTVGGNFKVNNKWQGSKGTISCGANGCNLTECSLSFYSSDYDKKLWAFGDSYFYDYVEDRWCKILIDNGFIGAMFDGYGGRTARGGLTSLKKCLKFGTPKQILWCLGMNNWDNSDSVNTEWNNVFEELKTLCKGKNIELILCTIPTTATANHEYKNAIIKSSGYRYVDIANALGADGTGAWHDGLLASDDIHPTGRGNKVIASRMMADVPELLG